LIGWVFTLIGAVPQSRQVSALSSGITWGPDTFLDIALLVISALLLVRFLRTGGLGMLRAMSANPSAVAEMVHHPHCGRSFPARRQARDHLARLQPHPAHRAARPIPRSAVRVQGRGRRRGAAVAACSG